MISVDDELEALLAEQPATPVEDEAEGLEFLYSSGTTGRPKAIQAEMSLPPIGTAPAIRIRPMSRSATIAILPVI